MTQPENVRRDGEGEVTVAPDAQPHGTHYAVKLHRRAGEQLCALCREFQRTYDREYGRLRRESAVIRASMNAAHRRWYDRTVRADPARAAVMNARRRGLLRATREREAYDQRHIIDEVAVRRAVSGEATPLNRPERLEAVRQLRDRGYGYNDIAERLGIAARQVHRDLTDLGLVDRKETVA